MSDVARFIAYGLAWLVLSAFLAALICNALALPAPAQLPVLMLVTALLMWPLSKVLR